MRSFGRRTRAARREPTPGTKQVKQNGKGWLEVVKRMATTSGISSARCPIGIATLATRIREFGSFAARSSKTRLVLAQPGRVSPDDRPPAVFLPAPNIDLCDHQLFTTAWLRSSNV